ncbi:MAG: tRNA 2-thiouridine(34) synthase MnmA [Propionibacteriaceae bacterium]|jgi:tRNA-specific 2-thiouridylase|nr:tRNA 2-thiouridine(34) synthase MnmA [Propionibacteriaceae bacterium]
MARLIAALSGGVDSAVAAARTVDAGHEVTAIHLALTRNPATFRTGSRGCCSLEDANDAGRVAAHLGIPFYIWDLSKEFEEEVLQDFLAEYSCGRTPNPCLRCNEKIKFAAVCDRALALGFDGVVTGHYAQLKTRDDGVVELHRSLDQAKDQSYVLGVLTQTQLQHCLFPLGGSLKEEVRREAHERGIRVADKPDSYDICFIPEGDTAEYLHEKLGYAHGEIQDEDGTVLGHHQGIFTYTIGQRKGLGLGVPAADGNPRYVLRLDPVENRVIVGPREHLQVHSLHGINPLWCDNPPNHPFQATVQLRAHATEVPALITIQSDGISITLEFPSYGIAPGQAAVIYKGTQVIGSATIDSTQ